MNHQPLGFINAVIPKEEAERSERVIVELFDSHLASRCSLQRFERQVLILRAKHVEGPVGALQHRPSELETVHLDSRGVAVSVCLRAVQVGLVDPFPDA